MEELLSTNLASLGTDCISRQAAIDALRYAQHRFTVADEAGGMGTVKWSEYVIYFAAAERVLSDLPSAQPEIIRCKDCQYWNKGSCECPEHAVNCQDYYVGDIETEAEYFCGYAEKREVNHESN